MPPSKKSRATLFALAEQRSKDANLGPNRISQKLVQDVDGLLSKRAVERELQKLRKLSVDAYITRVLEPAESTTLPSAKSMVRMINGKIYNEVDMGPLYAI